MSGLEVYGALAATASLVKVAIEVRKFCNKTVEELKALERAKVSGIHQITSLRIVFKSFASSFDKYNDDVIGLLGPKDKESIGDLIKDTQGVIERCEGTVSKLRALTKKKLRSKSELDVLREELSGAIATIQCLQESFNTHINLETLRRVSISRGSAELEPYISKKPLERRESDLESIAPASRQDTIVSTWSTQTLTPTLSSDSTDTTGSRSGYISNLTDSSQSILLVESEQLRSAVDENDGKRIEQLVRQKATEAEKEMCKASALFFACSFRQKSLVQPLLLLNPNVYVIDHSGRGLVHAIIGLYEQLSEIKEQDTVDILRLVVDRHPQLIKSTDKEKLQPLHYCAMTGNYLAAQYILTVDPSRINATDNRKKTPLYHICEHHSPNRRLVKLLLQNGGHFAKRNRPRMKDVRLEKIKKLLDDEERTRKLTLSS